MNAARKTLHRNDTSVRVSLATTPFDESEHYRLNTGPTQEYGDAAETVSAIRNIGWTLGNDCPYRCTHCYSMNARVRGRDMEPWMVDRIITELQDVGVATVNLGGNEPLFTNGPDPAKTLLPYIISRLVDAEIAVGLTTSGVTLTWLARHRPESLSLLNDVDVSFDSPFSHEHDENRGASIFGQAVQALQICAEYDIPRTCIMCGMSWNFSASHLEALVMLARRHDAFVRINPIKPIRPAHMDVALSPAQYYSGFQKLSELCEPVDVGEPPFAAASSCGGRRCPCGRTSFRIHSITPDGHIHISPCVYLHDFKAPDDLLRVRLRSILNSRQFSVFRQRHRNPNMINGCEDCDLLTTCGGGCVARAYLHELHCDGRKTMRARDPYCPREHRDASDVVTHWPKVGSPRLVHMDYLCTWIGKPRELPGSSDRGA